MFAQLGDIRFELVNSFEGLEGRTSYTFAEHQVVEGKPLLQYIGDNLDELTIQFRFHVVYSDPEAEFRRLIDAANLHQALPFVFGNGLYKGRFVITEISDTIENTAADGTVIAMGAKASLKEWVAASPLTNRQQQQKKQAPAIKRPGKKNPKTRYEDVPARTKAIVAAGYKLVDKKSIVRLP